MNLPVLRAQTQRALERTRAEHGELHPDTWTAYGRAIFAWGEDRLRLVAPRMPQLTVEFRISDRIALVAAMKRGTADAEREALVHDIIGYRERHYPADRYDEHAQESDRLELANLSLTDLRLVEGAVSDILDAGKATP